MKIALLKVLMVFVILTALCAAQTVSAADKLPLKHGLYAQKGEKCLNEYGEPISAVSLTYDGKKIYYSHEINWIESVHKNGDIYFVAVKSYSDGWMGSDATKETKGQLTIKIISRTSFSISFKEDKTMKGAKEYRYCGEDPNK